MSTTWNFKADWTTTPRNPDYQDLQNIALDQGRAGLGHWGGPIDAGGNELNNLGGFRLEPKALPASPSVGMIVTDIVDGITKQWTGSAWRVFASGYTPVFTLGAGNPSNSLGNSGDLYIDMNSGAVWGPKASGVWTMSVANFKGPTGPRGPIGAAVPTGAWDALRVYAQFEGVSFNGVNWVSLAGANLGHTPSLYPAWWYPLTAGGVIQYVPTPSVSSFTLTTAYVDIPGMTITANYSGTYFVNAVVDFYCSPGDETHILAARLVAGGVSNGRVAVLQTPNPNTYVTVPQQWVVAVNSGDVLKLQVTKSAGTGASFVAGHTSLTADWKGY